MKARIIFISVICSLLFVRCKKDDPAPAYSLEDMIRYNSAAALYFHVIFREAENAWALAEEAGYIEDRDIFFEENATKTDFKRITFSENEGSEYLLSIEYRNWTVSGVMLIGKITVKLPSGKFYRHSGTANITVHDFSIAKQRITGNSSISYQGSEEVNKYSYSLSNGGIRDAENDNLVLVTAAITGGTYTQNTENDDIWHFTGTMRGAIGNNGSINYTNVVLTSGDLFTGSGVDPFISFSANCRKPMGGIVQFTAVGQPDTYYFYNNCDGDIIINTITN
jgi:hypothetical protein